MAAGVSMRVAEIGRLLLVESEVFDGLREDVLDDKRPADK